MVHFFDHMTGDPFRQRGKDHTSKKQPDPPEVSAYQHQCRSGNSIDHTERSVYKASVYKAFSASPPLSRSQEPSRKNCRQKTATATHIRNIPSFITCPLCNFTAPTASIISRRLFHSLIVFLFFLPSDPPLRLRLNRYFTILPHNQKTGNPISTK